ncbi:MAG: esterase/lipase family protein [Candidatus Woesearchaeota archaeon]
MGLRKTLLALGLSAAIAGGITVSRPLEHIITNSKPFQNIALRYSMTHDQSTDIVIPEYRSGKSLLLIHGFAASEQFWGYPENPQSPISLAMDHYEGNVMTATYPSTRSIDDIAKSFNDILKEELDEGEKTDVLGYSMGGLVARAMVREEPQLFNNVGMVATPHSGFGIFPFTPVMRMLAPRYMSAALEGQGIEYSPKELSGITDALEGSDFLKELNTTKELEHRPNYNHFILSNHEGRRILRGKDDLLLSTDSTDPRKLIANENMEDAIHRSVTYFTGNVNHFSSFHHPDIARTVISMIRYGTDERLTRYGVREVPENELDFRRRLGF